MQRYHPSLIPHAKAEKRSKLMLVVVKTPSARFFAIGYYDDDYKKTCPWRDIYNNPLGKVTHYDPLPALPEE